ncbi:MAG: phasin family protein [Rhodovarius sp.]|nr:phasin family protein [Rhodovarius sp.]MCX7933445.1 phasin family protein [Rhodovarius sp.]
MPNPQEEFIRFFAELKLPELPDFGAIAEAQRRNIEALAQANRIALEGAQALARRNIEILRRSLEEMNEALRALTSEDSPQAKAQRQAELMKAAYERAMADLREVAELIQKANAEALGVLQARLAQALEELQRLVK